jgi:hypothetical protein
MTKVQTSILIVTASLLLSNPAATAQVANDEISTKIQLVKTTELLFDKSERFRELVKLVGRKGLSNLKLHADNSIAIQAAWSEALNSLSDKDKEHFYVPKDRVATSRFFGFLEGRAGISIPKWWTVKMSPSELDIKKRERWRRRSKKFGPDEFVYHQTGLHSIKGPTDTFLMRDKGAVVLKIGDDQARLPESISKLLDDRNDYQITGCFSPSTCYVAIHDSIGASHSIWSLSRDSEEVNWQKRVNGCLWSGGTTGFHESHVEVALQGDKLLVFGAAGTGFYAAGFESRSGEELFQFSTAMGCTN